jgi:hypothetical protein
VSSETSKSVVESPKTQKKNNTSADNAAKTDETSNIKKETSVGAHQVVETKPITSKNNNKSAPSKGNDKLAGLKQTNLSESMILIENDSSSDANNKSDRNKPTNRKNSTQSSSESLQDVDTEEGFITITSKKTRKPVRRET